MIAIIIIVLGIIGLFASRAITRRVHQRRQLAQSGVDKDAISAAIYGSSDERRLPYRLAVDDHTGVIFVHGRSVWTGVCLESTSDEFATPDELESQALYPAQTYAELLSAADGHPVDCHEIVRYRRVTTDAWVQQLDRHMWNSSRLFKVLTRRLSRHLQQATPRRVRYLLIRLGDFTALSIPDPLQKVAGDIIGVHDERFRPQDLAPFRDRARRFHEVLLGLGATAMTRQDLLWLIRKPLFGHLPVPDDPVTDVRVWTGGFFEMAVDFRGRNLPTAIEVHQVDLNTGDMRTSYVATLVVTHRPTRIMFNPGSAWAKRLANLHTPVEISWRYRLVPSDTFRRDAKKMINNIKDEAEDRDRGGAPEDLRFEQTVDRALDLQREIETEAPQPGMIGRLRFTVAAPTLKALAEAINAAKRALNNVDIYVERPTKAQYLLLEEQLPGDPPTNHLGALNSGTPAGLKLWEQVTDTYLSGVGLIGSHNAVGDQIESLRGRQLGWIGIPIGWVRTTGAPVYYDAHVQLARNRGAGVAILGASGGGKSTLALTQFFWMSEAGTQCVVLDPKNDFERYAYYIGFGNQINNPDFWQAAQAGTLGTGHSPFQPINREWWDATEIVDLARGQVGLLDPWRISNDFNSGEQLALSITELLFPVAEQQSLVRRAIRSMRNDWQQANDTGHQFVPAYGRLASYISKELEQLREDTQTFEVRERVSLHEEVIDRLERAARSRYSRLLIGSGDRTTSSWDRLSARRTIITMHGFKPPAHEDAGKWNEDERNAAAALYTVLHRVYALFDSAPRPNPITGTPGIPPRALFVDEGYVLARMPQGRALLSVGTRQGRSLNLIIIFIAQQPRDVAEIEKVSKDAGDADVNQFGTVFIFRQRTMSEARSGLALLRANTGSTTSSAHDDRLAQQLLEPKSGGLLDTGVCVMRDVDNRVCTVVVDQHFVELARASQTNASIRTEDHSLQLTAAPEDWALDSTTLLSVRTGVLDERLDDAEDFYPHEVDLQEDDLYDATGDRDVNESAIDDTSDERTLDETSDPEVHEIDHDQASLQPSVDDVTVSERATPPTPDSAPSPPTAPLLQHPTGSRPLPAPGQDNALKSPITRTPEPLRTRALKITQVPPPPPGYRPAPVPSRAPATPVPVREN